MQAPLRACFLRGEGLHSTFLCAITKTVHTKHERMVGMNEEGVVRIIREELEKNSNRGEATMQIEIRILTEVVSRIVRPAISEKLWEFFIKLTQTEPLLYTVYECDDGSTAALKSPHFFDLLKTLEKVFLLLINEFERTSEYFKAHWTKETLLEMMCAVSLLHDRALENHMNEENVLFPCEDARLLLDYIKCAEVGLVGVTLLRACVEEARIPLTIMKIHLDTLPA